MPVTDEEILACLMNDSEELTLADLNLYLRSAADHNYDIHAIINRWEPVVRRGFASLPNFLAQYPGVLPAQLTNVPVVNALTAAYLYTFLSDTMVWAITAHKQQISNALIFQFMKSTFDEITAALKCLGAFIIETDNASFEPPELNILATHIKDKHPLELQESMTLARRVIIDGNLKQKFERTAGNPGATLLYTRMTASSTSVGSELSAACKEFLQAHGFSSRKADLNAASSTKFPFYTPLTLAIKQRNVLAVTYLLNDDADINARNGVGNTPLHMLADVRGGGAEEQICKGLADALLIGSPDLSIRNDLGKTAFDIATEKGNSLAAVLRPRHVAPKPY